MSLSCAQVLAQASGASDAADWAAFTAGAADPARADKRQGHLFSTVKQGGPWLVQADGALGQQEQRLISMLVSQQWTQALAYLKEADPRVDQPDQLGRTPLTLAIQGGEMAMVRELIRRGAALDAPGQRGYTPLGLAAYLGDDLMVTELIRAGADLDALGATGQSAMHLACLAGQTRTVAALLKARPAKRWMTFNRSGRHPLAEAAFHGHIKVLDQLIGAGVPAEAPDQYRLNAVHAAALGRQRAMLDHLQAQGVPVPSAVTQILIDQMP